MTAPPFISEPVAGRVSTQPSGSEFAGTRAQFVSMSQGSLP